VQKSDGKTGNINVKQTAQLSQRDVICTEHYRFIFSHCDVIIFLIYRILRNNAKFGLLRLCAFKVTDFGTIRKPLCDFLSVINTNLILSRTVSKLAHI